jgi:hypothetical protein
MKVERKHLISSDLIYDTKVGPLIKDLEKQYGYNDYVNLVFYLLHEMNNPQSEWKPYLDILPRQLDTLAYKYWDKKQWIEEELMRTPILSNILIYSRKNC